MKKETAEKAFGSWKNAVKGGASYVRGIRKEWEKREAKGWKYEDARYAQCQRFFPDKRGENRSPVLSCHILDVKRFCFTTDRQ